jgi:imidazole glycerol-phosphate synthase subunit HisF
MLKKRLIFTLLVNRGVFQLSRNFSLQSVGTFDWLKKHYELMSISRSIDELVLLNVTKGDKQMDLFCESVSQLSTLCFTPIAAGGGIASMQDAYRLLDAGADKLVINSLLFSRPQLVEELAGTFGSQCVVTSLDYRRQNGRLEVHADAAKQPTGMTLEAAAHLAESVGAGELYVTSVERDGTGQGYDVEALELVSGCCRLPVIASGGVGNFEHFVDGLRLSGVSGASTANIFNFMGDGLTKARGFIEENGIELAKWDFSGMPFAAQSESARGHPA